MAVHARAVVADRRVDAGPSRGQEGEASAEAIADRAGLALELGPRLHRRERVAHIAHALIDIEAAAKLARGFDVVGAEAEIDAGFQAPEQIWRERDVSFFGPAVGDRADMGADAENLLEHQNPRTRA